LALAGHEEVISYARDVGEPAARAVKVYGEEFSEVGARGFFDARRTAL
jgi:hypothetical protein